jgi:hypothetical protein
MTGIVEVSSNNPNHTTPTEWPGIVSRFQLVILAVHRNKQLLLGAQPRIAADRQLKRLTAWREIRMSVGLVCSKDTRKRPSKSDDHGSTWLNGIAGPRDENSGSGLKTGAGNGYTDIRCLLSPDGYRTIR